MKKTINSSVPALTVWVLAGLALVGLALALPPAANAADCDVVYRLWQDGNNTYYDYGEQIQLTIGEKADLYIHYKSRSDNPYSTLAEIGAPRDLRIGGNKGSDIDRVLRLGQHDPRKGKQSFEAIAAGGTVLGYRITEVVRPGRLADIPAECRAGEVRIVVGPESRTLVEPEPASTTTGEAAHQLIGDLFNGLLRRGDSAVDDYPNEWFDRVQSDGLRGLTFVAETIASSREFQKAAIDRTRQALQATGVSAGSLSQGVLEDQLLTDICKSLYGSAMSDSSHRRLLANNLSNCLSGRGGAEGCKRFGRDLVSQSEYHNNNRDLLRHWQRY